MSDNKFTKGEWIIEKSYGEFSIEANHDEDGFFDLICEGIDAEANAHLIAAAPDMYNELEFIRNYLQGNRAIELKARVDALLAKARGEEL